MPLVQGEPDVLNGSPVQMAVKQSPIGGLAIWKKKEKRGPGSISDSLHTL